MQVDGYASERDLNLLFRILKRCGREQITPKAAADQLAEEWRLSLHNLVDRCEECRAKITVFHHPV